jgi:CubicO group peptidase (beta-lactamase class C family)
MTAHQPPEGQRPSRRTALALLGASTLAAGGAALAAPRAALATQSAPPADPGGPVPPGLRPGGEFDQFVREQAAQDQFSGNFLIAYRGRPVLARSYGMADKALSVPNALNTLFALASVTKAMTATAVLQLAQQGKLAFWETLGTYLSGFPAPIAETVTVHQLLTMTSGMDNYYYDPAWQPQSKTWTTAAQVLDGTMGFIRKQPLLFTPGTAYSYSNSGFVVLGAIVQQVSGQPYWDYMRQHVFAPAGMTRTGFYTRPQVLALNAKHELAHPYSTQRTGGPRVDLFGNPIFIGLPDGAGGPYITTPDLLSFATALQDGTLLNPAYAELILNGKFPLTPPASTSPTWQSWNSGYGLEDTIINNQHVLGHSGNGPGIAAGIDIYPDLNWVAVILENYDLTPFGTSTQMSPVADLERQLITQQAS